MIKRIHVTYTLRGAGDLDAEARERIDRVMARHAEFCPVARTIGDCVEITTELELVAK